mmetsp:Transcript_73383/g.215132  ORF Transcript_73383/g.215132 Transcript_73383/m.215132 type:complete len:276 (-) Transcript_73383:8-835(-)
MGAKCVRAVDPTFDKSPHWHQAEGLSPGGFEEAEVDKFLRDGHEQGPLEAMLERWTFGSGFQERSPHGRAQGQRCMKPVPVMLHVYDSVDHGFHLVSSSSDGFHCGIEVHGREWSFSSTAVCPGETTGVFVSAPRGCMGKNYDGSVNMGTTMCSQDEVLQAISSLKKDWPAPSYDALLRNSYHFCRELCDSLDVGTKIPEWVARRAIGESEPSCGAQMARIFCCSEGKSGHVQALEQVSTLPEDPRRNLDGDLGDSKMVRDGTERGRPAALCGCR